MSWSHRKGNTCKGWEKGGKPGGGTRDIERQKERLWSLCWGEEGEEREERWQPGGKSGGLSAEHKQQQQTADCRDLSPASALWSAKTPARWPDSATNQAADKPNLGHLTTPPPKSKFHFSNPSLKGIAVDPTLRSSCLASLFFRQGHCTLKEATTMEQRSNHAAHKPNGNTSETTDIGLPFTQLHLCVYPLKTKSTFELVAPWSHLSTMGN